MVPVFYILKNIKIRTDPENAAVVFPASAERMVALCLSKK